MRCQVLGHDKILYVCQSPNCAYMPLCKICKNNHNPQHNSYLIRYELALQKALKNLDSQIQKLQEYVAPIQKKKQTLWAVSKQIDALNDDKKRLIRKIQEQIDKQIRVLKQKNGDMQEEEQKFYQQLKRKMKSLQDMKEKAQKQSKVLRNALTMQIEHYLYSIAKKNPYFTQKTQAQRNDVNIAQLYVKTQHEMILSNLQLRKQILNPKLLKKVNNESPLYFLIDPKYQTSKYLHYFITQQQSLQLRIYDVQRQKWSKHINRDSISFNFTEDFVSVHDPEYRKFYYIGGKKYRPSNEIMWYDFDRNLWQKASLKVARHGAMAVIVRKKRKHELNYVLVAGGIGADNRVTKSWELFDPAQGKTIYEGEMNFASAMGRLVAFDGDVIFKIGGLADKSKNEFAICPVVEKCDFSALNDQDGIQQNNFKFSYVQVQDVVREDASQLQKPKYQLYYAGQGAIQINPNQILVFGGCLSNGGRNIDETYILNIQKFQMQNYKGDTIMANRYYARWINEKPLISPMNFYNFGHCIWNGKLYSLQDLPSRNDQIYKGLVEFDMKCWYETENIVDDKI